MGDINPVPPVRVESSSAGEERNTRDKSPQKSAKPVSVMRHDPVLPDASLDVDLDAGKDEKHELDERA